MKRRCLVLILLVCTNTIIGLAQIVSFRCDDFTMNLDSQNVEMLRLFEKYDAHLTCAIIPFDNDDKPLIENNASLDYLKYLQKKGIVEVALHGYKHVWTGIHGEIDGLPYDTQYNMLSKGKHLLDSVFETDIVSFVPPRNWYDESTIKVLEELHFENISACAVEGYPLLQTSMNQMPFSCGELRLLPKELCYSWGGGTNSYVSSI